MEAEKFSDQNARILEKNRAFGRIQTNATETKVGNQTPINGAAHTRNISIFSTQNAQYQQRLLSSRQNIQKRRSSFMTQNNNNILGANVIKNQREDESIYKKTDDSFDINESPFKKQSLYNPGHAQPSNIEIITNKVPIENQDLEVDEQK